VSTTGTNQRPLAANHFFECPPLVIRAKDDHDDLLLLALSVLILDFCNITNI